MNSNSLVRQCIEYAIIQGELDDSIPAWKFNVGSFPCTVGTHFLEFEGTCVYFDGITDLSKADGIASLISDVDKWIADTPYYYKDTAAVRAMRELATLCAYTFSFKDDDSQEILRVVNDDYVITHLPKFRITTVKTEDGFAVLDDSPGQLMRVVKGTLSVRNLLELSSKSRKERGSSKAEDFAEIGLYFTKDLSITMNAQYLAMIGDAILKAIGDEAFDELMDALRKSFE